MRAVVPNMYSGFSTVAQDRKRKYEDVSPASSQHLTSGQHTTDSAPSSLVSNSSQSKRPHLLNEEPHLLHVQKSNNTSHRQSFSGAQPLPQSDLHWTASDGYSTSNCSSKQPDMMEEDQQSVTPSLQQQHWNQLPAQSSGMSHSTSAPDLRLMLATELPDTRPMYLPVPGSYAGALVPYKGPEQMIAEAHQHVTSDFINRMIDDFNNAQAHPDAKHGSAALCRPMQMDPSADGHAPDVHKNLQHSCGQVPDLQQRKRIQSAALWAEQVMHQTKRARGSCSHKSRPIDSACAVDMED